MRALPCSLAEAAVAAGLFFTLCGFLSESVMEAAEKTGNVAIDFLKARYAWDAVIIVIFFNKFSLRTCNRIFFKRDCL